MSEFYDLLDEYLGDDDAIDDIRVVVRRLWFYDFAGYPTRLWEGKGTLYTSDGNEWLGTINAANDNLHKTPALQDGRDGSSGSYKLGLTVIGTTDETAFDLYESLKQDQSLVTGRKVTCYLAIFKFDEALRPSTPIVFFKELIMSSPQFSEKLETGGDMTVRRKYEVTVTARDNNFGRAATPKRTYADTIQKQRAKELGVAVDRGAEFLALLANRTYQIP